MNLGRINVICGKNNSGKSTLLQAITISHSRSAGRTLGREESMEIARRSLPATGWRGHPEDAARNLVFEGLCARVIAARSTWFSSDDVLFAGEFLNACKDDWQLRQWNVDSPGLAAAFRTQFAPEQATVLLPPKRALELSRSILLAEKLKADGGGLLNFLFLAKNQPTTDPKRALYDRIAEAFTSISSGYRFEIFASQENAIRLHFARQGSDWIVADSCGLGLQDLLIILYFAISAEQAVVLIEEPESHLHPDMQRRLLSFLRDQTDKQYILTTHSNVFVNNAFVDRVYFTTFGTQVSVTDETSRASMLDDLGYSVTDNLVSDLVILVEGPTDTPVIEEFLRKSGVYGRFEIKIWPLGGDNMDQLDLSVFAEKYKMLALIDADPGSSHVRRRFREKCSELGIPAHQLSRYAIENYFTVDALRFVFPEKIPSHVTA
jgi:energy-coupling factor transporter ATP-binding protein EcfA2